MFHSTDVIMSLMASQITSLTIVYSPVCSGTDQRKDRISASLAFVRGIHRGPVNSRHKRPVTRKMFPFDDVIMLGFVHFIRQRRFKQNACFDTKPMSEQRWRKLTLKCRANVLTYSHVGAGTKQSKFYQSIFLNKSRCIFIQVSLVELSGVPINNQSSLFHIKVCSQTEDKPLTKQITALFIDHICVTRPQSNSNSNLKWSYYQEVTRVLMIKVAKCEYNILRIFEYIHHFRCSRQKSLSMRVKITCRILIGEKCYVFFTVRRKLQACQSRTMSS